MTMQNADHKIIQHCLHLPPPQIFLSPEAEEQITILINDIFDLLEVRMFRRGVKDVVAGRS